MADYFTAAQDIIGGVTDLFGGNAEAKASNQAAAYYTEAAQLTDEGTSLKELQTSRNIYQVQSTAQASIAGGGLAAGGSAVDILRSNAQQGSMQKAIVEQQGRIQEQAYLGQAGQAQAEAAAQKSKGKGGLLGSVVGAAAAIF